MRVYKLIFGSEYSLGYLSATARSPRSRPTMKAYSFKPLHSPESDGRHHRPARTGHGHTFNGLPSGHVKKLATDQLATTIAQQSLQQKIDTSPRQVAQRQRLERLFGIQPLHHAQAPGTYSLNRKPHAQVDQKQKALTNPSNPVYQLKSPTRHVFPSFKGRVLGQIPGTIWGSTELKGGHIFKVSSTLSGATTYAQSLKRSCAIVKIKSYFAVVEITNAKAFTQASLVARSGAPVASVYKKDVPGVVAFVTADSYVMSPSTYAGRDFERRRPTEAHALGDFTRTFGPGLVFLRENRSQFFNVFETSMRELALATLETSYARVKQEKRAVYGVRNAERQLGPKDWRHDGQCCRTHVEEKSGDRQSAKQT